MERGTEVGENAPRNVEGLGRKCEGEKKTNENLSRFRYTSEVKVPFRRQKSVFKEEEGKMVRETAGGR